MNPLGWTSYTKIDPATGATTLSHDANGRDTETLYDGQGRLVSVWKPGSSRADQDVPDVHYTYALNTDKASVVQTDTLNAAGKITTTYMFFDSRADLGCAVHRVPRLVRVSTRDALLRVGDGDRGLRRQSGGRVEGQRRGGVALFGYLLAVLRTDAFIHPRGGAPSILIGRATRAASPTLRSPGR